MTFNDIQASFQVMLLKEENERVLSLKNENFMLMYITRIEKRKIPIIKLSSSAHNNNNNNNDKQITVSA